MEYKLRALGGEQTITVPDDEDPFVHAVHKAQEVSSILHCMVTIVDPSDGEEMLSIQNLVSK